MSEEFDTQIKLALYRIIADTAGAPTSVRLAEKMRVPESEIREAFARLHGKRLLVPEPDDPSHVRMAPPFSGIPTEFPVDAKGKRYYANCVWDAYGIAAALHSDAVIPARDGFTGEPLTLEVKNARPVLQPYVAHFAVPAALWWKDIVHT